MSEEEREKIKSLEGFQIIYSLKARRFINRKQEEEAAEILQNIPKENRTPENIINTLIDNGMMEESEKATALKDLNSYKRDNQFRYDTEVIEDIKTLQRRREKIHSIDRKSVV